MKTNFKKNGKGYISGCTISFGSKEMKDLNLVDENGNLKEIVSANNIDKNTILIKLKKEEKIMERINILNFDFKNREGEVLHCIEMVTNDEEEISKDLFECETEEIAIEKAEELNNNNNDKRYKFIAINYLVKDDELIAY